MRRGSVFAAVLGSALLLSGGTAFVVSAHAAAGDPSICDAPGNVVQNCGFETGDYGPWVHNDGSATAAEGVVDQGNENGFGPNSGTWDYDDGAVGAPDTLTQSLALEPGETYDWSFYAQNDEPTATVDSFVVTVDTPIHGSSTTQRLFTDDGTTIPDSYQRQSGTFTVPANATTSTSSHLTTSTLTFTIQGGQSYYQIDDVVVAPVSSSPTPTPSATSTTVVCPPDQSCSATVFSPTTGQTATITAAPIIATGLTTLSASFGTVAAPLYPCDVAVPAVLTFSGNRQKTITLSRTTDTPSPVFCYGQPTPFFQANGHLTTHFSQANQEYKGILPLCRSSRPGPCISSMVYQQGVQTITAQSGANDPHISY